MRTAKVALKKVKLNPNNPRTIRGEQFKRLVKSGYKEIPGYRDYLCSPLGKIISFKKTPKEIKGCKDRDGYLKTAIVRDDGTLVHHRMHRLIAMAFLGLSEKEINHKDSNKTNNNPLNLEYVTLAENQCHRRLASGYFVGVCWAKKENKWRAYIQHEKKWMHLGFYKTKEDAKEAYILKSKEMMIGNKYAAV